MKNKLLKIGLILVLLIVTATPAIAAPAPQSAAPDSGGGLGNLMVQWVGLAGCAGLIAFLINIFKTLGWVKDGHAQTWSAGLNLIGLALLLLMQVYKPDLAIGEIDSQVGEFVQVGTVVFGYVIQLLASKGTHVAVRGVPLIGKTHTE